jgi:8-oxo-dGTP pyrophosphatase MutT (NUDIX family)
MRRIAALVQKTPWAINAARVIWRLWQPKFSAGVVGVVFNAQRHVLLVEHVFHPYSPWGLPGGWVERGEDPAQTVQRELLEELEMTVEVGPVLLVDNEYGNHLDLAYLCYSNGTVGMIPCACLACIPFTIGRFSRR